MNRRPEKTFSQGIHTDGQQIHEKILKVLIVREMQIKTTVSYCFTPNGHQKGHK